MGGHAIAMATATSKVNLPLRFDEASMFGFGSCLG
jgi:hypothetical protein